MNKKESNWQGKDRRRHPRREVWLEIYYQHLDDFFYDYAINLSRGGMFIKTIRPLPIGTNLQLRISVPKKQAVIQTTGRVVRVVKPEDPSGLPPGMGIEFHTLSEKDIELINALWEEEAHRVQKEGAKEQK